MTFLSLLISTAYIPGITGAAIPTGWAAMSLALPFATWRRVTMTPIHWLGLAFVVYAFASMAWAPRRDDAINELWHLSLFALSFILGSQVKGLRGFWRGLAIGCGISSAIAIAQWWGGIHWQILPTSDWGKPPGLFFNNAVAGAVAGAVVIGCATEMMWKWVALPLPLLLLSQSRGAWLAVIGTYALMVWNALRWRDRVLFAVAWSIPITVAILYYHTGSDPLRLEIWKALLEHLSLLGSGAGSSQTIFLISSGQAFHIEHAHNDYMQLLYEFGLGCLPLALAITLLLEHRDERTLPPFLYFLILSGYFWTLEAPVTLYALGVVAGCRARSLGLVWNNSNRWGLAFLPRFLAWGPATNPARG